MKTVLSVILAMGLVSTANAQTGIDQRTRQALNNIMEIQVQVDGAVREMHRQDCITTAQLNRYNQLRENRTRALRAINGSRASIANFDRAVGQMSDLHGQYTNQMRARINRYGGCRAR